jgi:hypothetical protein
MASELDHTNHELASRLISAADAIANPAAAGLERDLRAAATILRGETAEQTTPLIPRLMSELTRIANYTTDADMQRRLRKLIGEAQ